MQSPPDITIGATITSFVFIATESLPSEINVNLFSHHMNAAFVQSSVTGIDYYIYCIPLSSVRKSYVLAMSVRPHDGSPTVAQQLFGLTVQK
jgi:hypothetical protein